MSSATPARQPDRTETDADTTASTYRLSFVGDTRVADDGDDGGDGEPAYPRPRGETPCRDVVDALARLCEPEVSDALFRAGTGGALSRRERDLALRALALLGAIAAVVPALLSLLA